MTVRMIVIMPHVVSWIMKMTIQIRNRINVNIYEEIYGSNLSDEYISSGEKFIYKNKLRKRFTDGLFKCFKNALMISSTNFYIECKNDEIDSTKYQFENSQILYN